MQVSGQRKVARKEKRRDVASRSWLEEQILSDASAQFDMAAASV